MSRPPFQFTLTALLVLTACYAGWLGLLCALGLSPVEVSVATLFITAVGLGQRFLFGGKKPGSGAAVAGMGVVAGAFLPGVYVLVRYAEKALHSLGRR